VLHGMAHSCHMANTIQRPCAAVMRPYVKFLWPIVLFITKHMQIVTKSLLLKVLQLSIAF